MLSKILKKCFSRRLLITYVVLMTVTLVILLGDKLYLFSKTKPVFVNSTPNLLKAKEVHVILSAIGDIMMHIPVKQSAEQHNKIDTKTKTSLNNGGFDFLFSTTKDVFDSDDITIANMEFPIREPYKSMPFKFNCAPIVLEAIKSASIDLLTLANNHSYDQGVKGLTSTIEELTKRDIPFIGAGLTFTSAHTPYIFEKSDIKIGLIGYTGVFNDNLNQSKKEKPHANKLYNKKEVLKDIKSLKGTVDYIILVSHHGIEYKTKPTKEDADLLKEYIEAGVGIVIGHHPHVLQNVERYNASDGRLCYIFHSLGNFVSNQSRHHVLGKKKSQSPLPRETVIVRLKITKTYHPFLDKHYVRITDLELIPVWCVNHFEYMIDNSKSKKKKSKKKSKKRRKKLAVIRPVLLNQLIKDLEINANNDKIKLKIIEHYKDIKKQIFETLDVLDWYDINKQVM